jgi:ubiquitin-protein ligase
MPVLNLKHVLFGLLVLFSEPNPDDPLNKGTLFCPVCSHTQISTTIALACHPSTQPP